MEEYTREELIKICKKSFVLQKDWRDRDSADAQIQLGKCYALLVDGCNYRILHEGNLSTGNDTIWLEIEYEGFDFHDYGGETEKDNFYLPTIRRLDRGGDWY